MVEEVLPVEVARVDEGGEGGEEVADFAQVDV